MPIQRSSSAEIRQLIDALIGADETRRESAIARLAVIGARATEHLLQEFPGATARGRAALLLAMERLADPRALAPAMAALGDPSASMQTAAIGVMRALITADKADVSRDAYDALVTIALDRGRAADVRLAAWDAIRDVGAGRDAVREALAADPDPEVRRRVAAGRPRAVPDGGDIWRDALEGRLPAWPGVLKTALASQKAAARLTDLQRLVDRVRARERQEEDSLVREEWRAVRGGLHQALAARNSRLALYDLRDSLLADERLPVAFLAAMEDIGDATCLEPLAAAFDQSSRSGDTWWREHLASAFRAIVHREGLTRRHAALKRVLSRWPDAAAELMGR